MKTTKGVSEKELLLKMREEFVNTGYLSSETWDEIFFNNYYNPVLLLVDESTFLDKLDKRLEILNWFNYKMRILKGVE